MPRRDVPPRKRREIPPSKLPLSEQAQLFERLRRAKDQSPPQTWQQLSDREGFAVRTLEHFWKSAISLEKNADPRSLAEVLLEQLGVAQEPPAATGEPNNKDEEGASGSSENGERQEGGDTEPRQETEERQLAKGRRRWARKQQRLAQKRREAEASELTKERREAEERDVVRQAEAAQRFREMLEAALQEQEAQAEFKRSEEGPEKEPGLGDYWDEWWGPEP